MEKEKDNLENADDLDNTDLDENNLNKNIIIDDSLNDENEDINNRIYDIEYRLQELEIILDQLEQKVIEDIDNEIYIEQFTHAKEEYKGLLSERKKLIKSIRLKDTSKANQISSWIYFYGIFIFIICFPFLSYSIWLDFASGLLDIISGMSKNIGTGSFLYYLFTFLTIFSMPLILSLISWMLYINLMRKPLDKKAFIIVWITQSLLSLGMIIYMSILMFGK